MSRLPKHRRRRHSEAELPSGALLPVLGVLLVCGFAGLLAVAFRAQQGGVPLRSYHHLRVEFKSAQNVGPHGAQVRVAGRLVGQAQATRLDHGIATVEIQLAADTAALPVDTRATLRPQGLLGAEYVDLIPGHSKRMLPDNGVIPVSRTRAFVQLPDVLGTFDARTRRALRQLLQGLGTGFAGRGGQLHDALRVAPTVARDVSTALGPLRARAGSISRLINSAGAFSSAVTPTRGALASSFDPAAKALEPLLSERRSVSRLLVQAASDLPRLRANLAQTDPLLDSATSFARAATHFTAAAPHGLRALDRFLSEARQPLKSAPQLLRLVPPAVPPTLRLSRALQLALPRLAATLPPLQSSLEAIVPYACEIPAVGRRWFSLLAGEIPGKSGRLGPGTSLHIAFGLVQVGNGPSLPGAGRTVTDTPCQPLGGTDGT
jgi:phospholipid/cholesterol/gamma-HCH transport system substrate-binding protein